MELMTTPATELAATPNNMAACVMSILKLASKEGLSHQKLTTVRDILQIGETNVLTGYQYEIYRLTKNVPYPLIRELAKEKLSLRCVRDCLRLIKEKLTKSGVRGAIPYGYLKPKLEDGKVSFQKATTEAIQSTCETLIKETSNAYRKILYQ